MTIGQKQRGNPQDKYGRQVIEAAENNICLRNKVKIAIFQPEA